MYIKINNLTKSFKLFKRSAGLKGALKSFFNREYQTFTALDNINLEIIENYSDVMDNESMISYIKFFETIFFL